MPLEKDNKVQLPLECNCSPASALICMLQNTAHTKHRGFHQRELCLNKGMIHGKLRPQMNEKEKIQTVTEMNEQETAM